MDNFAEFDVELDYSEWEIGGYWDFLSSIHNFCVTQQKNRNDFVVTGITPLLHT